MKQNIICNLIITCVLGGAAVNAQTNGASASALHAVKIESLVDEALNNNPELRLFQAEIDAAKAGSKTAGQISNPELSADVGRKTVDGSGPDDEGNVWSVSVMQPFEWPGRIGLRKAIASRDTELAELGLARFRAALAGRVRARAYDLSAAQEKATAAREVAERLTALRDVLVQRDPAGITPLLETRVVEATELTAQRTAGEATIEAQAALLELNALRGVAPDTKLSVVDTPLVFQPLENKDVLLAVARTNNFDIRVRALELAQQGDRVALAKKEQFSGMAVGPSFSEERAGERERVISLGLSVPLPLWNRNRGIIDVAKARQMQAETSLDLARREIEQRVAEAALMYGAKVSEMAGWRPDALQHFQEAAEVADRHYRLGAVPMATFIELQQQYLETVDSVLATKKDARDAAQQLELLTGLPTFLVTTGSREKTR